MLHLLGLFAVPLVILLTDRAADQVVLLAHSFAARLGPDERMEAEQHSFGMAALRLLTALVQTSNTVADELLIRPDRYAIRSKLQVAPRTW